MSDMELVVVGAAGRMGQTLIRTIHAIDGARASPAPSSAPARLCSARMPARLAGVGAHRRRRSPTTRCRPSPRPTACSISPRRPPRVEFAGYAAQARIVHVIGTTGCSADDDAKIAAAARHADDRQVRQYEPRRQPAGGAGRAGGAGARRRGLRHRDPRNAPPPQGRRAVGHRAAARRGRRRRAAASISPSTRVRVARRPYRRARAAARSALPRCAAARWSATIRCIFAGDGRAHHAVASAPRTARSSRAAPSRRRCGRAASKPGLYSMRDVLGLADR